MLYVADISVYISVLMSIETILTSDSLKKIYQSVSCVQRPFQISENKWENETVSVAAFSSAITKMECLENHYVTGDLHFSAL